ncbi:MAG: hydantoinase B/oxoprolinase family protein [Betaproteobacteria bacterium]|nr:MAG: hydantoinase B/oxoprolinase family protein [Betaproteobacteria bacterium]
MAGARESKVLVQAARRAAAGAARRFDPIAMEVFSNRLMSITEDMNNTLVRSSFSTNIKERRDCSVALFDRRGRLVAQGTQIPLHLGSLDGGIRALIERVPLDHIREGDAFICNDPYLANGTHLPDITIITPVFWQGKIEFFAANIGHHADVGGAVPGSIAGGSRSVFEEGIRLPVTRICKSGSLDAELLELIAVNTRDPEERKLDLQVQIATNQCGVSEAQGLIRQMGIDAVRAAIDDVIEYTSRRIRNRIAALEPGEYVFTDYLDDDGMGGDPVPIRARVHVHGEGLEIDFSGSGQQARGAMNVPLNALQACVYYSVKALIDPELLPNAGLFDAVSIHAPLGTIVNPRPPAAVGARSITCQKVCGAIFGAFRELLPPERVMASGNDVVPAIVFAGELTRREGYYVYLETLGGGSGARFNADGMDAVHVHMTNTSNLPVEALENEYPLHVDENALVTDSGGAGRWRGGMGIARQIRAVVSNTIFSVRSDSHTVGVPTGVFGGLDGRRARLIQNYGSPEAKVLYSKVARIEMGPGDSMRIETPGGGGYGPPAERDLRALAQDLRDGRISRAAAERDYGADRVAAALRQA